jgi:putative peptidoglycan lipid II flippase
MNAVRVLFKVNIIIGFATLIGLVNNIVIAAFFGLSRSLDAYFAACLIPNLFMTLIIDYLGKNFFPVFSKMINEEYGKASRLTSSVINIVFVVSTMITLLLVVFSRNLFSLILPGFSQAEVVEVAKMFCIMSPVIVLRAVSAFNEYVWQYNEQYSRIALANALPPIVILCVLILGNDIFGIYSLPVGFLLGNTLVFIFLSCGVSYQYHLRINFRGREIKSIFLNSSIMTLSGLITRLRPLIQQYFASRLGAGAISALSLASRLCMPLQQRATTGIRMMVFTRSSKAMAKGDIEEFGNLYRSTLIVLSFFMVPLVFCIGVNADEIVKILFMRGAFDDEMSRLVALALLGSIPSIVFLSATPILLNAFYVLNNIYVPALIGPTAMIIYFLAMWALMDNYGVLGIAASVSIAGAFQFFTLVVILSFKLKTFSFSSIFGKLFLYCFLAAGIFVATKVLVSKFFEIDLLKLCFTAGIGFSIYLFILWIINDWGFDYIKEKFLGAIKKQPT